MTSNGRRIAGFVGVMDYRPNVDAVVWFVENCWERIRAACPKAVFRIIGRGPTRRVRRLAKVPGVEVVGGVDDVAAEVRQLAVSVAPMRIARGLQNKVLEAMAAAKPVVLTAKAAEGIRARDGQHYLIADHAADIIQRVTRLLNDPEERARIGTAARRFVAANHCLEDELQMFELIVAGTSEPKSIKVESIPGAVATQLEDELVPITVRSGR
jgi:glycosyltransferase involved in cell wall biosynthesis